VSRARRRVVLNGVKGGGVNHPWAKTHWTRQEAADYLRIVKRTIQRWEERGIIVFKKDEWGQSWFDPADVRRMPANRSVGRRGFPESSEGKLQALILIMIREGVPFVDIAIKLQIPLKKVRAIHTESQYELDDVLPLKPEKAADLQRDKLRLQKSVVDLEALKAENERLAHERRLAKIHAEEEEAIRLEERRKRMGTRNLRPEGSSDE
jgi:DNA-binding transcriptional MerR regulator